MSFSILETGKNILNQTKNIIVKTSNSTFLSPLNTLNDIQPEISNLNQGLFMLIGGVFCLLAILIAGHQIVLHLHYFHKPNLQMFIVRILLMVPVRKFYFISILSSRFIVLALGLNYAFPKIIFDFN